MNEKEAPKEPRLQLAGCWQALANAKQSVERRSKQVKARDLPISAHDTHGMECPW